MNNLKLETSDARRKTVDLKNVETISNIEIVRDSESDIDMSSVSDVSDVSDVKPKKMKKVLRPKVHQTHPQPHQSHPQPHRMNNDFSAFSNPKKISRHHQREEYSESESEYSSMEEDSEDGYSEYSEPSKKTSWAEQQKLKQDLLIKIQALEKKGFEFSKKYNMTSNYEEMMFDYEKIKKFIESQAAIKFSRRCLMACVTGLEFLNKKFDPFNVKLEGWSENVMENVDDYDNIFERLHEKYSGKAEIAPEIELLLTLGGSAFMFHLTNSLLKSPVMGGSINTIAQNNPNFMQSMMGMMNQGMKEMNQMKPNTAPQMRPGPPQPVETRGIRKEMRGPSIDPQLYTNNPNQYQNQFPNNNINQYPIPPMPQTYYQESMQDDDRVSIASSDSSLSSVSVSPRNISVNKAKPGKKGKVGGIELNIS